MKLATKDVENIIRSEIAIQVSTEVPKGSSERVCVVGKKSSAKFKKEMQKNLPEWQFEKISGDFTKASLQTPQGTLRTLCVAEPRIENYCPDSLRPSPWGTARDEVGAAVAQISQEGPLIIEFFDCSKEQMKGALVGLYMGRYKFKAKLQQKLKVYLKFHGQKLSSKEIEGASLLGISVNLSRHLVNLPPDDLNPENYVKLMQGLLKGGKVNVLDAPKLKAQGFGLMAAVGRGASSGPYLFHFQVRSGPKKQKPRAYVGKGITFDTGGLDLKPSANMRLMKKDMGGSATLAGLAYYLHNSKAKVNADIYLAIAENAISEKSIRPSDVVVSKKGLSVEIQNTDAEGRLVLADALYHAATSKETPHSIVDVATLTGAIKVGLGAYLPGLFCDNSALEKVLQKSAKLRGEPVWSMPLDPALEGHLRSDFADCGNWTEGFGGAIAAALFLRKFTEDLPWAHFDIYAWNDSPRGALTSRGGSGQLVQTLVCALEGE